MWAWVPEENDHIAGRDYFLSGHFAGLQRGSWLADRCETRRKKDSNPGLRRTGQERRRGERPGSKPSEKREGLKESTSLQEGRALDKDRPLWGESELHLRRSWVVGGEFGGQWAGGVTAWRSWALEGTEQISRDKERRTDLGNCAVFAGRVLTTPGAAGVELPAFPQRPHTTPHPPQRPHTWGAGHATAPPRSSAPPQASQPLWGNTPLMVCGTPWALTSPSKCASFVPSVSLCSHEIVSAYHDFFISTPLQQLPDTRDSCLDINNSSLSTLPRWE